MRSYVDLLSVCPEVNSGFSYVLRERMLQDELRRKMAFFKNNSAFYQFVVKRYFPILCPVVILGFQKISSLFPMKVQFFLAARQRLIPQG